MEIVFVEKLINHWKKSNVYSPPGDLFLIEQMLKSKNIQLPDDFKHLYRFVGGPTEEDSEFFYFYPPEELATMGSLFSLSKNDQFYDVVVFVDYMQSSWWYGFKMTDDGYQIGIISSKDRFKVITDSLSDFINLYVEDSGILYNWE